MANDQSPTNGSMSTREKILSEIDPDDFAWAVPFMRAGYAGRALVYLVVAGVSLWSMMLGGEAEGTGSTLRGLSGATGGAVVVLVAAGMFAYAIWRIVASIWDLEASGRSFKGILARSGMMVTGFVHAGIGVIAIAALGVRAASDGGQSLLARVMQAPMGPMLIGAVGLGTLGMGLYYFYKAISQKYRDDLQANHFTRHWNPLLRAGLIAQGISISIIGGLIAFAASTVDPSQVGGLDAAFEWLREQSYGKSLVIGLCVGLLGFSLFCFVNAVYRIVPKASDRSVESLAQSLNKAIT